MLGKYVNAGIKAKLTFTMAALVLLNVVALTIFSYLSMRNAVEQQASFKLQQVGEIQSAKFSDVLHAIDVDLELQAEHPMIRAALRDFTRAFAALDDPLRQLQDAYINNNPHPLGQKDQLQTAGSGSDYDRLHAQYHPVLDALQDAMGYYDVFLFDTAGNLVYSVFKELDYATNMNTGEWRETGLAEAFRLANAAAADAPASFVDFAPYAPSADAPAAFISKPVFDDAGRRLGALVYQMPIDALNANMRAVMGEDLKVEAFAVGPGNFLITDLPQTAENDILSRVFQGSVLEEARSAGSALLTYTDPDGREFLGYASAVDFYGADWFVVVQEQTSSLFAQVIEARTKEIFVGLTAFGLALLVAMYLSRSLTAPLHKVTGAVESVAAKNYDIIVPGTDRSDEIGSIARSLDEFRVELAEAEAAARDAAFKSAAFESTGAPMLLTDLDLKIVGANDAYLRLVNENPIDFEIGGDALTHENLVDIDLANYVFPPEEIRAAVSDHSILPIKRKMPVGESYVGLLIDLVRAKDGSPIGYVFDMKNQTFQMLSETVLHAIDEQQARIEFDLSAKIKLANARACDAFGLTEEDLVGRDGKALLSFEDHGNTGADVWQAALEGEGTGGRFRLQGEAGQRIVEGNFSPVPDQNGVSKGFLLIGNDVTEARRQIQQAEEERQRNAEELQKVIGELSTALAHVADGGLSTTIAREFTGEYEKLRIDFNSAVARLGNTIGKVIEVSELIASESSGINSAVTELSSRTEAQAATLEQTTAAMTELANSVASSSEEAQTAARFAAEARTSAESSGKIVREAADAMSEIEDSSQKVSKIIGVIDDIAFQTNLLALNAGVEAARAGDAGRGFAVVASEVRALAQRCLEASNEITSLITVSGESVTRGVDLVGQAASALEGIASGVVRISDNVAHIAEASDEQSKGLGEIRAALVNLDQMTQHNAAMAEETTAAAQSLENVATELRETTSTQFTLSETRSQHDAQDRLAG